MASNVPQLPKAQSDGPKKLVLCFDGTSNKFNANEEDTNIVRIYEMLDRNTPDQYHYYQPGIGTYTEGPMSNSTNNGVFSSIKIWCSETWDEMFGSSFVHHVVAGYQFILRYYAPGDKIYIFGFSRGAYTARFLTEMIDNIGLLSRGNDEMIRFAWDTFSDYQRLSGAVTRDEELELEELNELESEQGRIEVEDPRVKKFKEQRHGPNDESYHLPGDSVLYSTRDGCPKHKRPTTKEEAMAYMIKFRTTFCREKVSVYFLGLFDCVASVNQFDIRKGSSPDIPRLPARHVRHAVSIHERRVKFKPSLFQTNNKGPPRGTRSIKEVWFAGNHGDVGGGWNLKKKKGSTEQPKFLLSDIPLQWMVQEVKAADQEEHDNNSLAWRENAVKWLGKHTSAQIESWKVDPKKHLAKAALAKASVHDPVRFGGGLPWYSVCQWRFIELLAFPRYSLKLAPTADYKYNEVWTFKHFPANYGELRDIPNDATFHVSVKTMAQSKAKVLHGLPNTKAGDKGNWFIRFLRFLVCKELPEPDPDVTNVDAKFLNGRDPRDLNLPMKWAS